MLETLEEPPANVYFILCTTEPAKLFDTVKSRCALSKYVVKPLTRRQVKEVIAGVIDSEGANWDARQITALARISDGIPREALMLLDSLIELKGNRLTKALKEIEKQSKELPIELARAITNKQSWKEVARILTALEEEDVEGVRRLMLGYLRKVLRDNPSAYIAEAVEQFEDNFYDSGMAGLTLACYKALQL